MKSNDINRVTKWCGERKDAYSYLCARRFDLPKNYKLINKEQIEWLYDVINLYEAWGDL